MGTTLDPEIQVELLQVFQPHSKWLLLLNLRKWRAVGKNLPETVQRPQSQKLYKAAAASLGLGCREN